jgi:hypothetical protein
VNRHVPHLLVLAGQLLLDSGGKPFGLRDRIDWLWLGLQRALLRLNELLDLALSSFGPRLSGLAFSAFVQQHVQGNLRLGWRRRHNRGRLRDDGLSYWLGCWLCLLVISRYRLKDRLNISRQCVWLSNFDLLFHCVFSSIVGEPRTAL